MKQIAPSMHMLIQTRLPQRTASCGSSPRQVESKPRTTVQETSPVRPPSWRSSSSTWFPSHGPHGLRKGAVGCVRTRSRSAFPFELSLGDKSIGLRLLNVESVEWSSVFTTLGWVEDEGVEGDIIGSDFKLEIRRRIVGTQGYEGFHDLVFIRSGRW